MNPTNFLIRSIERQLASDFLSNLIKYLQYRKSFARVIFCLIFKITMNFGLNFFFFITGLELFCFVCLDERIFGGNIILDDNSNFSM